jgi:hypothetical protein
VGGKDGIHDGLMFQDVLRVDFQASFPNRDALQGKEKRAGTTGFSWFFDRASGKRIAKPALLPG